MTFASKNLWNLANYAVRQAFLFEHIYLNNAAVYHLVKSSQAFPLVWFQAVPSKPPTNSITSSARKSRRGL